MEKVKWVIVLVAMLFFTACTDTITKISEMETDEISIVWPTEKWAESSPEQQGMNSEKLAKMFEFISSSNKNNLHGLLVVRNGHIVTEKYHWPYDQNYPHNTYSVTKSLTGAVTGVAIDEGIINLDDKVFDFFHEMTFENMSEEKENMTIEQLLTMTNGMDWPEWLKMKELFAEWDSSENQLQYYLNQPVIKERVGSFNYDTGAALTIAAIIEKETGMELSDYAQEKIFGRIGINSLEWRKTKDGTTNGGTYAQMTPRDMAKFGYLYLHGGKWDGEQIIPEEWVQASINNDNENAEYGYFFWLTEDEDGNQGYTAMGAYNQYISIFPKDNLIVVQTSNSYDFNTLLSDYILPSVESDEPLPENEEAYTKLMELTKKWD